MSNKEIGVKNKFVPVMGISMAISIFNTIPVTARTNIGTNSHRRYSDRKHLQSVNTLVAFAKIPPQRQLPDSRWRSQIAQASDSQNNTDRETIELNRKSISDLEQLDPDANPLLFPTQPSEVEIEELQPITIEQAIELALKNNKDIVEARVEIEEAAVEEATRTFRDAQIIEESGVGTKFDVLRARVELTQVRQRLVLAVAERDIARRELAETLSIDENADLAAADAIAPAGIWKRSLPESIVLAFKNRAELEQLLLQKEISESQRTVALSPFRPTITTAANYTLKDDFDDRFDLTDEYSLGLNIQWRLFDGGAASAGAQQAEKEIEIAETQFANTRNEIRLAVERAYLRLISNQDNLDTANQGVELAESSLEMARLRFQEGIGTQTDVIDAQTVLTSARGSLLVAIIQYNQSYADLQRQVSNTPDNS